MLSIEPGAPVAAGLPDGHTRWPWEAERYRLWSLWDMLAAYAFVWSQIWTALCQCEIELNSHMHSFAGRGLLGSAHSVPLPRNFRNNLLLLIQQMLPAAEHLGLVRSIPDIQRLRTSLVVHETTLTVAEVHRRLLELRERVEHELLACRFLFVPNAKTAFYDQQELFGQLVSDKFAKASFHIKEAGNCLALNRSTAAVFHLMCVLEVGLDSLAHSVGLPYSEKNWGTILNDVERQIQAIALGKSPASAHWDSTWYSQAAVRFFHFKEAWRNHTQHGRTKYTEEEAESVFGHVKAFMQHLATRLRERS